MKISPLLLEPHHGHQGGSLHEADLIRVGLHFDRADEVVGRTSDFVSASGGRSRQTWIGGRQRQASPDIGQGARWVAGPEPDAGADKVAISRSWGRSHGPGGFRLGARVAERGEQHGAGASGRGGEDPTPIGERAEPRGRRAEVGHKGGAHGVQPVNFVGVVQGEQFGQVAVAAVGQEGPEPEPHVPRLGRSRRAASASPRAAVVRPQTDLRPTPPVPG